MLLVVLLIDEWQLGIIIGIGTTICIQFLLAACQLRLDASHARGTCYTL